MQNPETDKPRVKPVHVHLNDKELRGLGYVRAWDGAVLDNRDHFNESHPDSVGTYDTRTIATYDKRTHVAVSKSLLFKLLEAYEEKLNAEK